MKYILADIKLSLTILTLLLITSCVTDRYTATEAFHKKQFSDAARLFEEELSTSKELSDDDKAEYAYRIGQCYEHIDKVSESRKWYKIAIDQNYGPDAIYK
jgi:hypothetical protein